MSVGRTDVGDRLLSRALRLLVVIAAVGVLLAAFLVWRLSRGPLDLAVLTPYVERALSRPDGSLEVRIAGTELAWNAREHHVDLRARDAQVLGPGGEAIARLPAIALGIAPIRHRSFTEPSLSVATHFVDPRRTKRG